MKKLVSVILVLSMLFTAAAPCYAAWSPEETQAILEIQETLDSITNSVERIGKGSKETISAITTAFGAIGKVGSVLAAVNGSVAFLRLIGVIEDPTAKALAQIQDQLETIDDKLTNMTQSLNSIAGDITKLTATEEFHNRGQKAMTLQQNWTDFAYRYMEHSLDELMTDFEVLVADGMKAWCGNIPAEDLVINYIANGSAFEALYGADNAADADATLTISKAAFPASISWNINTYLESIQAIVTEALASEENYTINDIAGIGIEVNEATIEQIAIDAANQVVYEVTVDAINDDTSFVYDVRDAYENFCSHLLAAQEGIDAMLNTMYLTHAFQYQIKEDINEFFDQMIVKVGTYGMFASDILGMSDSVYNSAKISAMETMCNTVKALEYARDHAIVGTKKQSVDSKYDNYCYITNTLVYYTDARFESDLEAKTTEWRGAFNISYKRYESVKSSDIEFRYLNGGVPSDATMIGDTDALMILYTLESNGISGNYHQYFKSNICPQSCSDHGQMVTSYQNMATVPNDGTIKMALFHVIGNWFPNTKKIVTLNHLPGDTETKYIREKKGVQGSVIDFSSGGYELSANVPLHVVAIYAEGHSKWTVDEIGFLAGPGTEEYDGYYYNPSSKSGESYTYTCATWHDYNVLVQDYVEIEPKVELQLSACASPLESYLDILAELDAEGESVSERVSGGGSVSVKRPLTVTAPGMVIAPIGFKDVAAGSWYEEYVNYCIDHELMNGLSRTVFGPQETTTRAQVAVMLYRLAGEPAFMNDNVFSDVVSGSWYEKAVVWANGKGIVTGYDAETFGPNDLVTREQLATLLYRFAQYMECDVSAAENTNILSYDDAFSIHSYAMIPLQWACASGIVNGVGSKLMPAGFATRAEVAAMFTRFYKIR